MESSVDRVSPSPKAARLIKRGWPLVVVGAAIVMVLIAILLGATMRSEGATPPPAATHRGQQLITGVSYVAGSDAEFSRVKSAGAEYVHTWLKWASVAPESQPQSWLPGDPADPHYDWGEVDNWVINATRAGLVPLLQIYGAPKWAQRCGQTSSTGAPCDVDPAALAQFAVAAARRYSGSFHGLPRVRYWQAQNEPNLSLFFNPQFEGGRPVSPTRYRTIINMFYSAVKSVDPSNIVLAAGLAPIGRPGSAIAPLRFTEMLLCMKGGQHPRPIRGDCGGGVDFDVFDIHPYTTGGPTHRGTGGDVQLGNLNELQNLLRAADRAGRINGKFAHTPLWITEFSWDSNPPDPGGLPMRIETRWVAEALYQAWSVGIGHFFWFTIHDDPPNPALPFSETHQSGLYFFGSDGTDGRPKKELYAFRFPFVAYSRYNGFFFWGRTPTSTPGSVTIQVQEGGRWRDASVAHADANGIFTGVAEGRYGRKEHGMVRALYRGEEAVPFSLQPVRDFRQPPFGRQSRFQFLKNLDEPTSESIDSRALRTLRRAR